MQQETVIFNRQIIRLFKGILKAWEQWVDEVEYVKTQKRHGVESKALEPQIGRKNEGNPNGRTMNP
ncbi:MAG: hypothetical protein NPIRA06_30230 [Nitrospirales bacterium]|nr:MAG: hypothetical protein NPIRA06_30230 [Nitrospirales bacterium]